MLNKTISLIYTYGLKNGGDMAINLGAIDVLLNLGFEVKLFSRFSESNKEFIKSKDYLANIYPNLKLYPSPFELKRDSNLFNKFKYNFNGLLTILGLNKQTKFLKEFLDSDLVVFNGGNLFRAESFSDYTRLLALMYPLQIARKNSIPYIIFPQSASKINSLGKKLLDRNLKSSEEVWTRENISFDYLNKKFDLNNLHKSIDLSFFTEEHEYAQDKYNERYNIANDNSKRTIAFTIRTQVVGDLGELDGKKAEKIINVLKNTISQYINNDKFEIVLVIQTRKDKKITKKTYSLFEQNKNISLIEEYDPLVLKEIYSHCDLLIGMRLHSIILSLSAGTPAIGYFEESWGYKNPGMMKKFDLPFQFIKNDFIDFSKEVEMIFENEFEIKDRISNIIEKEKKEFLKSIKKFD